MGKAWLNFNIPKGEKFTGPKWLTFAVMAAATVAVWNYSDRIPYVGPPLGKVKTFVLKVVGGRATI
ncbi:hypothetical protein ES703_41566 [subsurface metagenome]